MTNTIMLWWYRYVIFDLDFWPKIPMVLEIEAPSEDRVKFVKVS